MALISGTPQNGTWSGQVTVPASAPSGTIEPRNIAVFDVAGNQTQYFPGEAEFRDFGAARFVNGDTTTKGAIITVRPG